MDEECTKPLQLLEATSSDVPGCFRFVLPVSELIGTVQFDMAATNSKDPELNNLRRAQLPS